ncbi:hypothetical protein F511_20405 [Dorcoceras hygrometricum]|uniref:Uncharacterized protein n=1 Tax=Dorcoceras hygrometricum TaxID=472368 RepID=A0A2Z7D9P6_9LAMI|nr:hypothetical protein F511_20405 [Dorcoceras hygrometricum]
MAATRSESKIEVLEKAVNNFQGNTIVALVMVAAGSRRTIVRVIEEATRVWFEEPVADEKRRRLVKWKRYVLRIASGTSSEGFVALFIQSRDIYCSRRLVILRTAAVGLYIEGLIDT